MLSTSNFDAVVSFENQYGRQVRLYWIDGTGGEVLLETMSRASKTSLQTYIGHTFRAKDNASGKVVASYVVKQIDERFVVTTPVEVNQSPFDPANFGSELLLAWSPLGAQEAPAIEKWSAVYKQFELDRLGNERRREQLNRDQPAVVPTFTETGFAITKVPDALWDKVQQFWHANRHRTVSENWDKGNSYVNHWEIQPTMAYLPQSLKDETFRAIQPILEKWAGVELVPTACYGIRLYHRGSRLQNHVDRLDTHAISAIINVDQEIDEPWALEIQDHNDTMHKIYIEPKDMVLYESASRIHGRPSPFKGKFFANMFVHYRPHEWVDVRI